MTNEEVAAVFEELAVKLREKKELPFKIRAYQKAATAIRELPVPVEQFRREHDLREIPGVGDAIAKKINELLDTGTFPLLQRLNC
ncbi:MAG TPA: hypothetical protein VF960_06065 [Chloroflexota bacterium]